MRKFIWIVPILGIVIVISLSLPFHTEAEKKASAEEGRPVGMAVEFNNHAACAFIAREKGWFEEEKHRISAYQSYITGMSLASALARGDIQVAYICLVPAINAYANAMVPIKIVAGTHKYGYGLVVNPDKIKTVKELEKPGIRIGCVRDGGTVDVLLHKTIDNYALDAGEILHRVQRMSPPKQVLAIKMKQLDAAFLPEHWATMAEDFGFSMLLTARDVWPEMQGSVLAVKEELIRDDPEIVRGLMKATQRGTDWANERPNEAATIMARQMSITGKQVFPLKAENVAVRLDITPQVFLRSMTRMDYTTAINAIAVQQAIDYLYHLGYIKKAFNAEHILDLRFLK
jgi:NitT/TauT family transport system substrate-binding protein